MGNIKTVESSDIGGGNSRTTTTWEGGNSRDVDRDSQGTVVTVTDHKPDGSSVSGDGVNGGMGGATRLNDR
jgi:hypothetical protein